MVGQHRSALRRHRVQHQDEEALTSAMIALAARFGRYGYRWITALLRAGGWHMNEVKATLAEGRVSAVDGLSHLEA